MLGKGLLIKELRLVIVGPYVRGRDERLKLLDFFYRRQAKKVVFIGHPVAGATARRSLLITAENGIQHRSLLPRCKEIGYLSYLIDLVITLWFLIMSRSRYDIYFGFGVSYAPLGLLLRRLRIVKRVILWTTDYSLSVGCGSRLVNQVYNAIHRVCVESADYLWDVSPLIKEARRERGLKIGEKRVVTVPYMLDRDEIEALPVEQICWYEVIQAGLMSDSEFALLLEAIEMVAASIPEVRVTVVSYGTIPQVWQTKIKERGLERNFAILGYIEDEAEFSRITQRHRAGLAIYPPDSFKKYGDPARVKTYIAKGLPVIITRVPLIWQKVVSHGAGIAIDYDRKQLAAAVLRLLTDDRFYEECREGALRLAAQYDTETIFRDALQRMNILCDAGERI